MKLAFAYLLVPVGFSTTAFAQTPLQVDPTTSDSSGTSATAISAKNEERREVPIVAYTYAAYGVPAKTVGVQAYGTGLVASGQDNVASGGATVWGSPIDRLTIVVDARRSLSREFAPSAAAIVRLVGTGREGFSLGALGKFKVEGFDAGPSKDEVESEAELGVLVSYSSSGWYGDLNAIAGRGLGDEGEADAETRLRLGRDLSSSVRVGIDGQARLRLAGPQYLPNGRTWDFAAGPQVLAYVGDFFGSLTAGPTTTSLVTTNVGWSAMLAFGGMTF